MRSARSRIERTLTRAPKPEERLKISRVLTKKYQRRAHLKTQEAIGRFKHALGIRRELFIRGQIIIDPRSSFATRFGENIGSALVIAGATARYTLPLGIAVGLAVSPSIKGAVIGLITGPFAAGGAYRVFARIKLGRDQSLFAEYDALARILERRKLFIAGKKPLSKQEIEHNQKVVGELEEHLAQLDHQTKEVLRQLG